MESIIKSEGSERYTVFPIKYQNLWKFYKDHIATFWTVEEIRLSDDLVDWNEKLNDNEKYFLKNVLAFFASSDGIVNENLVMNFYNEVQISEARSFYTVQMMIETIHNETYSILIDTYINNTDEKNKLFNAMETIPAVKKKADWALKWIQEGNILNEVIPQKYMNSYKLLQDSCGDDDHTEALQFLIKKRPSFAQRLLHQELS
jgi:ribonucleoside-diphosphate reductase beta chain